MFTNSKWVQCKYGVYHGKYLCMYGYLKKIYIYKYTAGLTMSIPSLTGINSCIHQRHQLWFHKKAAERGESLSRMVRHKARDQIGRDLKSRGGDHTAVEFSQCDFRYLQMSVWRFGVKWWNTEKHAFHSLNSKAAQHFPNLSQAQAVKFMLDYMYQTDASVSPTPRAWVIMGRQDVYWGEM